MYHSWLPQVGFVFRVLGSGFWMYAGSQGLGFTLNSIKSETGLRPNSAGIPYTLLLRIEAIGFPTFGPLL